MPDTTQPTIIAIIGPHAPLIPITPGALLEDLRLDQLARQTIAVELDEMFGIEIPDVDVEGWRTVADIEASVRKLGRIAA